jgi:hypothetical protein
MPSLYSLKLKKKHFKIIHFINNKPAIPHMGAQMIAFPTVELKRCHAFQYAYVGLPIRTIIYEEHTFVIFHHALCPTHTLSLVLSHTTFAAS